MEYSHELIMPNDDIPFKLFLFEGKDGHYVREKHWHRSVEIFALFEGEIDFFINDLVYHLKPGECMLVNSNEIHSVHAPNENQTVVLQIPLSTFERHYTDERFIYFSNSSLIQDREVMDLIREIYEVYIQKGCGYEWKVMGEFYLLLYLLITKYRMEKVDTKLIRQHKKLDSLSAITAYMKENYASEMSLESVAAVFGYSSAYFSRMFYRYTGINYKNYLDSLRLAHAYKDLANSDMAIGDIAVNNGFANSRSFAKLFKEKYGILPSEFRRCHGSV
ncbi:MAG: AraC family transcriptional regulator [Dorea sp.]|jgi:AraC-like DNA-binding protein/mannose-6-phosphate isomerase-like protein (cupin superfamily)|nr:AraC family transcriptional regulator [Dorea sp.]